MFEYAGIKNTDIGLQVNGHINIPYPQERIQKIQVPGRDGDLTVIEKNREDIEIVIPLNYISSAENWSKVWREAKKWLKKKNEKLILEGDAGYFYKCRYVSVGTNERKSLRVGNFTATFVCEGYQYAIEGQYPLELKFTEGNESKYCIVRNSYDTSYPLYQISGNGTFDLEVNGKHMRGSCAGRLTIDTDREISYKDNKSANTDVTGTYKDLSLEEDENIVKITQGFDLVIIPRWRE